MDNKRPTCKFFERGFCRNGNACRFEHAIPKGGARSLEEVCRFYQQGHCRYGNSCRFRHGNSPPVKIQEEEKEEEKEKEKEEEKEEEEEEEGDEESETEDELDSFYERHISLTLGRMEHYGRYGEMTEEEAVNDMEQRMRNCGFNDEEMEELFCHGVKPYDSDADMVLAALSNDYWDEYYMGFDSWDDNDDLFGGLDDEDGLFGGLDEDEDEDEDEHDKQASEDSGADDTTD